MRLTGELFSEAPVVINPEKMCALQLRGQRIPNIEDLGPIQDVFEVLDLTDNHLTDLGGFPVLNRLRVLLAAGNIIISINDNSLADKLPHLNSLSLINNRISKFSDIKALSYFKELNNLALLGNSIRDLENYRYFVIWLIPSLKVLDFKKVKQREIEEAKNLFGPDKSKPDKVVFSLLAEPNSSVPRKCSQDQNKETAIPPEAPSLSDERKAELLKKLLSAQSLEEIEEIENELKKV